MGSNFAEGRGVSIHAPVMDAKAYIAVLLRAMLVSIHAPVMDANVWLLAVQALIAFQSTRP